ncbi:universal stress protein PHOS32 isoform X2 [Beta vulgaris subsp. vulgaris]|uniref:universal stress protein PHOS32 isoform X2 n=1 Tax=Beta vulgaris subsp. vulgaris TaxID=3555 RepID=UPI002036B20F|nr:universal stress protein PHOS32 isoform X2 [Beta vulgaris subsp. vulgaris]
MGKTRGKKLQAFCVNRIRPLVKVPVQNKLGSNSPYYSVKKSDQNNQVEGNNYAKIEEDSEKLKTSDQGRKIMVVVDSSVEAKVALQWALTHTVQSHDSIILLYVAKLTTKIEKEESRKKMSPKIYELLHSMKKTCQSKMPEVEVEVKMAEGKEKGPTIIEEARKQEVSLLVLGQKKQSTTWRLLLMWASNKVATGVGGGGVGVVEYCIQHATCMALAVRRKSKRVGGYLITTKRHKDFWLLA